jgi:hypothetical protein
MTLTPESYTDWICMVKSYAEAYQIWDYINPVITKILIEPKRPEPSDYQSEVVRFIDLDADS